MSLRFKHTYQDRTTRERIAYWWEHVSMNASALWDSIWSAPPIKKDVFVQLNPGDPGYDDCFFELGIDESPLRFEK